MGDRIARASWRDPQIPATLARAPAFLGDMDALTVEPAKLLEDLAWVRRLAARLVSDPSTADDLAQETWVRALEHAPRGSRLTRAWLGTVLRNLVRERRRRLERRRSREERAARSDRVRSTDELAAEIELQGRIARCVLELDEPYRSTVLLRFVHDLEPAQIALRLQIPAATIRSRLKRALDMLRVRLDREHGGDRSIWMRAAAPWTLAAGHGIPSASGASLVLGGILMKTWGWGLAAVLAIALGVVWSTVERGPERVTPSPAVADVPSVAASDPSSDFVSGDSPSDAQRSKVSETRGAEPPVTPPAVRGRVVDLDGEPIAGVEVFVGAEQDPFPESSSLRAMGLDRFKGRITVSGSDGTFEALLAGPGPVRVHARFGAPWRASMQDPRARIDLSVDAPAEDLELVLVGNAWGRIATTVVDTATGSPVEKFHLRVQSESFGYGTRGAVDGRCDLEVPLLSGAAERVTLTVLKPSNDSPTSREVVLHPNENLEVVLAIQSEHVLRGRVLDRAGRPVADASVFFGTLRQARGDEPFEPFTPADAFGARSDVEGRFEIAGTGDVVSAWHPLHATATVPVGEAWSIVLGERGTILGRGAPGSALTWDETTSVEVVGSEFRIDDVDPGAHRLTLADGSDVGVRVAPGETLHVDLSRRLERVELGLGDASDAAGYLLGLDDVFSPLEFRGEGAFAELKDVFPGRYHVFLFDGRQGRARIEGPSAELELGRAEVTLLATPGARIVLSPADADDLLATLAARLPILVAESGRVVLASWPAGRWNARLEPAGEPRAFDVEDESLELDLR